MPFGRRVPVAERPVVFASREQARRDAISAHRALPGQIAYWAQVGRAALDNPDLPVSFRRRAGHYRSGAGHP